MRSSMGCGTCSCNSSHRVAAAIPGCRYNQISFTSAADAAESAAVMNHYDVYVSYFAMPVAVLICFGPAIVAWLLAEEKSSDGQEPNKPDKK